MIDINTGRYYADDSDNYGDWPDTGDHGQVDPEYEASEYYDGDAAYRASIRQASHEGAICLSETDDH
jgi:hypothetical protein